MQNKASAKSATLQNSGSAYSAALPSKTSANHAVTPKHFQEGGGSFYLMPLLKKNFPEKFSGILYNYLFFYGVLFTNLLSCLKSIV